MPLPPVLAGGVNVNTGAADGAVYPVMTGALGTLVISSAAVAVNDVIYPPLAFIDQTAQAGFRRKTEVIQKLLRAPRSLDRARNKNRTPIVQSASIDSSSPSRCSSTTTVSVPKR